MTDESVLGEPADLAGLLERVVLPVLRAMLEPGESVDDISLAWEGGPPSRGRSDLLLSVVIETETFRWIALTQGAAQDDDARSRARLASDLQDFIAESRFARGELRPHPF